jgi:S-adenosyl methyltransferase
VDHPGGAAGVIDITRPSTARIYDYILGGAHNFAVDRAVADEMIRTAPGLVATLRTNRIFLRHAVRYLTRQGIRQFLDLGSGVPTVSSVHEVAQGIAPESTVVYVDFDPVTVAHCQVILDGNDRAGVLCADLREPEVIMASVRQMGLIDVGRPVAVLLCGVLHFLPDSDRPADLVARLRRPLVTGGYLVLTHTTLDGQPPEVVAAQKYASQTPTPVYPRTREQVMAYFGGMTLVEPGLVFTPEWLGDPAEPSTSYAGIGRL